MAIKYDERLPIRPTNKQKVLELHAQLNAYRDIGYGHKSKPWTREICIALGKLYFEAWGKVPISRHMNTQFGLPSNKIIKNIFGEFSAFYEAIQVDKTHSGVVETF